MFTYRKIALPSNNLKRSRMLVFMNTNQNKYFWTRSRTTNNLLCFVESLYKHMVIIVHYFLICTILYNTVIGHNISFMWSKCYLKLPKVHISHYACYTKYLHILSIKTSSSTIYMIKNIYIIIYNYIYIYWRVFYRVRKSMILWISNDAKWRNM